eukprot:799465-Rhodomonas_salina.1
MSGTHIAYAAVCLRTDRAMPGTNLARSLTYALPYQHPSLPFLSVLSTPSTYLSPAHPPVSLFPPPPSLHASAFLLCRCLS